MTQPNYIVLIHKPNCRRLALPPLPCNCWVDLRIVSAVPESFVMVRPGLWIDSSKRRRLCNMEIAKVSE